MSDPIDKMTERQRAAWPEAVAEAARYVGSISDRPGYYWTFNFEEEARPGRGHLVDATWTNGEHYVQIRMDVYGYPSVSVAELSWLHSSSNEECGCEHCAKEREDEG